MKNGKCPKCNLSNACFKEYALDVVNLDGKLID